MSSGSLYEAQQYRKNIKASLAFADTFQEQLRMAGTVQRDFLPRQLPENDRIRWATNFLPAEWVSGDIYDIDRLDENHIGFYLADVVGHGIPAALLTMFVKQAMVLRETYQSSYRIFDPADVLTNVNRKMISQDLSGNQFITCCYCLLNVKDLTLTYCRAGHPHPVLLSPGKEPERFDGKGTLIGIFEEAHYTSQTVQLHKGDKLLVYSDGVESAIGTVDDNQNFKFKKSFLSICEAPVKKFSLELKKLALNRNLKDGEEDDLTTITLEIL